MPAKEHTDNCANLAIAKRCDKCRKLARMPAKEHTDNCANLAIAKRCDKCRKLYENEKKRRQRKEISDKKYKTRCAKKKSESKYAHVLCDECRDNERTKKYLCKKCKLRYIIAQKQASRQKIRENKILLKSQSSPMLSKGKKIENTTVDIKNRSNIGLNDSNITKASNSLKGIPPAKNNKKGKDKNRNNPKNSVNSSKNKTKNVKDSEITPKNPTKTLTNLILVI